MPTSPPGDPTPLPLCTQGQIGNVSTLLIQTTLFKDPSLGGRWEVQDGELMYTHGCIMSMYGKNHYNIVK